MNPWVHKEEKVKQERVWYLASRIKWTDTFSPDIVFSRAGRESWTFCTVHVDNVLAKKPDACRTVLVEFWRRMLQHRIDGIGGDFNRAANTIVDAALQEASDELREPGESLQQVNWNKFKTRHDSMVYYQVTYNNTAPLHFSQSKRANRIQAQDVGFRKGDRDWHKPLLVTFRPTTGETRGDMPDAYGRAAPAALRTGHRQRSRPFREPPLPVGLQSRPAEVLRASLSSSTKRLADRGGGVYCTAFSEETRKSNMVVVIAIVVDSWS